MNSKKFVCACLITAVTCFGEGAGSTARQTDNDKPDIALPPIAVRGIHVQPDLPSVRMGVEMFLNLNLDLGWPGAVGHFVMTPGRVPQGLKNVPFSAMVYDAGTLRTASARNLGAALQFTGLTLQAPEETPRLRGVPVLVLKDGLPANDPFDGSVPWGEMPRASFLRAEIVPGGGATAWGAGAVGGVIQLFAEPARGRLVTEPGDQRGRAIDGGPPKRHVEPVGRLNLVLGEHGTRQAEWVTSQPTRYGILQVLGGIHGTDGSPVLAGNQRGAVDDPAWMRGRWLEARWRQPAGKDTELLASVEAHENSRGEGTVGQHHKSRGGMFSVTMAGNRAGEFAWNGSLYLQAASNSGSLSEIESGRAAETPILTLDETPTVAVGASWTGSWWTSPEARTTIGASVRHVHGEGRQQFAFTGGNFSRETITSGGQSSVGVFLLRQQPIGSAVRALLGARLEAWHQRGGDHREIDRATGGLLSATSFTDDGNLAFNPTLGFVWQVSKNWRVRAGGQSAFRPPTLAERYQTWGRQGSIIAASPALAAEKSTSLEAAVEFYSPAGITLGVTGFQNLLNDSIGSRAAPALSVLPLLGAPPYELALRERINLDRAEVRGLSLSAGWRPTSALRIEASLAFHDSMISRVAAAPAMAGNRLAHVPDRIALLRASWQPTKELQLGFQLRSLGRRFADEENLLRLGDALLADVGAVYRLNSRATLHLTVENIANARSEANRDPRGLVYFDSPRLVATGVRFDW